MKNPVNPNPTCRRKPQPASKLTDPKTYRGPLFPRNQTTTDVDLAKKKKK